MLEVHDMIEAGETELAREELRYLLRECPDFLEAHQMLGQIALDAGDTALARGHFGYVYDLVRKAMPAAAKGDALPYALCANRMVHDSAKSLAIALHQLGQVATAIAVGEQLLAWDASDPLSVRPLLESWRA